MKTTKLLTIIFMCILLLCGCSNKKKSITGDDFINTCNDLNISYNDVGFDYGFANEAIQIEEDDYILLFIEGKNINDMSGMFYDDLSNIYKTTIDDSNIEVKKNIKTGKNWKSFEATISDKYYYLIYIDNTYMFIKAKNNNVEEMKKIRKAIDY